MATAQTCAQCHEMINGRMTTAYSGVPPVEVYYHPRCWRMTPEEIEADRQRIADLTRADEIANAADLVRMAFVDATERQRGKVLAVLGIGVR